MTAIFIKIVNMSLAAGCLIIAVILLRLMLRRQAPKWVIPILWLLVGVRLALPVSIESPFSLIPDTAAVQQESSDSDTVVISGGNFALTVSENTGNLTADDGVDVSGTASSAENSDVDTSGNASSAESSGADSSGTTFSANESDTVVSEDSSSVNLSSANASSANAFSADADSADADSADGAISSPAADGQTNEIRLSSDVFAAISIVWIVGMVIILAYGLASYARLSRRMKTAVRLRENIYQSEWVKSPFLLGIIRPRIYIPWQISGNGGSNIEPNETSDSHVSPAEADAEIAGAWNSHANHMESNTDISNISNSNRNPLEYVIAHEQAHIRRHDHWTKPIGFVLLAVYWFNPLVWVAYLLFCKDIEYACDEAVIRHLNAAHRADYSETLLNCHVVQHRFAACPIAFGETSVKMRVKSILNYRRPTLWRSGIAILLCVVLSMCFLTNPVSGKSVTEAVQELRAQIETLDVENITHVELQLTDKVLVDADVTPYENYKDGITAYYADTYRDGASEYTTEAVAENSLLFGTAVEEQIALLAEYMGTEFTYEESKITLLDSMCTIKVPDANEDIAWISWSVKDYGLGTSELLYPSTSDYAALAHGALETMDLGNYEIGDVSEEVRAQAEEAKNFVSDLTGEALSDYSLCIPLEEAGEDTWAYVFYYELDGLPWMCQEIGAWSDGDSSVSQDVADRTSSGLSTILPMSAACITYQDGKPIEVAVPLFSQEGDVYQEQTAVLGLDDILLTAGEYFDNVFVTEDITITNIRLVYNTYYSDGTDGEETRYVAYPFWCLQYYKDAEGYGNTCILFDAYTGEFVSEKNQKF